MKESIGYRIRKLRELNDYTQDNMGAELGITAGAYAKIERDETDPSAKRLMQIAEILEVDVTYFFQNNASNQKMLDKTSSYGPASKYEFEQLTFLVESLKREIEIIKQEINSLKKTPKKSHK